MSALLQARASLHGGVFRHAEALACGFSPAEIRQALASGRWVRVRRGVYAEGAALPELGTLDRHRLEAAAALLVIGRPAFVSHLSAARLLELPVLREADAPVELTVVQGPSRRYPGLLLRPAGLDRSEHVWRHQLPTTSATRTVLDVARSRPFESAVVVADAALRASLTTAEPLSAWTIDHHTWPGIRRARRVLEFADGRSESVGESVSRVRLTAAGLPAPDLQVQLDLGGGRARLDFLWRAMRTVGEFDGRLKYGRAEDLWAEKLREDRLRALGFQVVRWTWDEIWQQPGMVADRVRQAFARAARG